MLRCEHGVYIPQPINLRSPKELDDDVTKQLVKEYSLAEMKQWQQAQNPACSVCSGCDTTGLRKVVVGRPFVEFPKLRERRRLKDRPEATWTNYLGGDVHLKSSSIDGMSLEEVKTLLPDVGEVEVQEYYEYCQEHARPTNPDAQVFIYRPNLRDKKCQCVGCLLDHAVPKAISPRRYDGKNIFFSDVWTRAAKVTWIDRRKRKTKGIGPVGLSQFVPVIEPVGTILVKPPVTRLKPVIDDVISRRWTVGRALNHAKSVMEAWDTESLTNLSKVDEDTLIAKMDGTRDGDYPKLRDSLEYQRSELEVGASAPEKMEAFILWEVQRALSNRSKYDGTMSDNTIAASIRKDWSRRKWSYPKPHPVMRWFPSYRPDAMRREITAFLRGITGEQVRRLREMLDDRVCVFARQQTREMWDSVMKSLDRQGLLRAAEPLEVKTARLQAATLAYKKIGTSPQ